MSKETDELTRLRQRKMQAFIEEKQRREATKEVVTQREEQREKHLQTIFMPDAIEYLAELRSTKPQLAKRIEDIALTLLFRRQLVNRIPKLGVILVQRRLEGVEPKISVKRRGEEAVSFYEAVRKDLSDET